MDAVRGPKKKKGESEAKIESTDIINIFKERADPQIKDIREYPIYVQELSYGNNTCHEHLLGVMHNTEQKVHAGPFRCLTDPTTTVSSSPSNVNAPSPSANSSIPIATPTS